MIDYVTGKLKTLTPTSATIENAGIGYLFEISLQTYDSLAGKDECTLYVQKQVNQRDGSEVDYGFSSKDERELFRNITAVSGMGAASARMILSSMSPSELRETILSEDINRLKSIKGIGLKSAQRLVLELKDKIYKSDASEISITIPENRNEPAAEAAAALLSLGFAKPNISKAIQKILKEKPGSGVEEIIKNALRIL